MSEWASPSRRQFLETAALSLASLTFPKSSSGADYGAPKALPTRVSELTRCPAHPLTYPVVNGLPLGSPATKETSYPTVGFAKSSNTNHLIVGVELGLSFVHDTNGEHVDAEAILERSAAFRFIDATLESYLAQPRAVQVDVRDATTFKVSGPGLRYDRVGADILPMNNRITDALGNVAKTDLYRGSARALYRVEYRFSNALCEAVANAGHPLLNPAFQHGEERDGWAVVALIKNQGGLSVPLISGDQGVDFIERQVLWGQDTSDIKGGYAIIPVTVELPKPAMPKLTLRKETSGIVLKFLSQEHVIYQIEASTNLDPDGWQAVSPSLHGDGREIEQRLSGESSSRFYRLQVTLNLQSYLQALETS